MTFHRDKPAVIYVKAKYSEGVRKKWFFCEGGYNILTGKLTKPDWVQTSDLSNYHKIIKCQGIYYYRFKFSFHNL